MKDAIPEPALAAEKAVLGAIFAGGDPAVALAVVRAGDFQRSDHRRLFAKIEELCAAGRPIDPFSVGTELVGLDGGVAYVLSLASGMPNRANIGEYARLVRDRSDARRLATACQRTLDTLMADPAAIRNGVPGVLRDVLDRVAVPAIPTRDVFQTARALTTTTPASVQWITKPYVAAGSITELSGRAKVAGKTSFILYQCGCRIGGMSFLGEPTSPGPVVYLTEEAPTSFVQALRRAGLHDSVDLHVLSFWQCGTQSWPTIVALAVARARDVGAAQIVVDTLSKFAKFKEEGENSSGAAEEALKPIHDAAGAHQLAFILSRHERKGGGDVGESARGSSAFTGGADIVLALQRPEGRIRDTVRVLKALSRFEETQDSLMIERQIHSRQLGSEFGENEPGPAIYVSLGTETAVQSRAAEDAILESLPATEEHAITADDLSAKHPDVKRRTLDRAIKTLTEAGRVRRLGSGKKAKPYRYFNSIEAAS